VADFRTIKPLDYRAATKTAPQHNRWMWTYWRFVPSSSLTGTSLISSQYSALIGSLTNSAAPETLQLLQALRDSGRVSWSLTWLSVSTTSTIKQHNCLTTETILHYRAFTEFTGRHLTSSWIRAHHCPFSINTELQYILYDITHILLHKIFRWK